MTYLVPGLGLFTFGVAEAVLIFGVLMLLFGAKKLPMLARGLGSGIRNFKGELQAPADDDDDDPDSRTPQA